MTAGPLIVQSDKTLLLEVSHPDAPAARANIAPFAELERAPEHVHTYRITPLALWNARAAGHSVMRAPTQPRRGVAMVLVLIAIVWVVSTVTDGAGKKDPNTFATGAGGGAGGPKAKEFKTKVVPKNIKSLAKTNTRITSKNANASMAVTSMPSMSSPGSARARVTRPAM